MIFGVPVTGMNKANRKRTETDAKTVKYLDLVGGVAAFRRG